MNQKKKDHTAFRERLAKTLQLFAKRRQSTLDIEKEPQSIVILARECYGDCIMLTPLIGTLRREYPDLSIYIIAFSRIIFNFFSADTNVTAVYHAKRDLKRYIKEILTKKFDILFNPKDHPSTHFLIQSLLINARHKVGHFNPYHEGLFDHLITMSPNTHESEKNLSLLQVINQAALKNPCKPYLPPMPVSPETAAFLETIPTGRLVAINISAGHTGGRRTTEQWSRLIQDFPDETFIILSAPGELAEKRQIELPHANVLPSPSTRNIYEVGKIVKKLKLLVTPDTSLVHIAACYNTPILALYRKRLADRTQFAPLSTQQQIIISPTPDVIDIDPKEVTTTLQNLLKTLS